MAAGETLNCQKKDFVGKTLLIHHDGQWREEPVFDDKWGLIDYYKQQLIVINDFVGNTITLSQLGALVAKQEKSLKNHILVYTYLKDGVKHIVKTDEELQTWWLSVHADDRGRVHLFLDHQARPRRVSPRKHSQPRPSKVSPMQPSQPDPIPIPAQPNEDMQPQCTPKQPATTLGTLRTFSSIRKTKVCAIGPLKSPTGTIMGHKRKLYRSTCEKNIQTEQVTHNSGTEIDKDGTKVDEHNEDFWAAVCAHELLADQAGLEHASRASPKRSKINMGKKASTNDVPEFVSDGVGVDATDLPEEELDEMPNPEGVLPNFDELPVEEEYHSGYSSSSDYDYDPEKDVDVDSESVHTELYDEQADVDEDTFNNGSLEVEMGEHEHPSTEFERIAATTDDLYMDEECWEESKIEGPYEKMFVGMEWQSIYHCRRFLRRHAVRRRFEIQYLKNDFKRVRAKCSEGCPWFFFASKERGQHTFKLRTYSEKHECDHLCKTTNKMVNCKFVAEELEDAIRAHKQKSYKPGHIIAEFWREFTVDISYWVAWRARSIALERIYGNYEDGYKMAPEMCRQLLLANPGSVATCSRWHIDNTFTGCCIAFKPFLDGFISSCRPIIGLDGCFLKGKYGGVCLSATALDGNNGLYPLAIYICNGENYETWKKFLEIIKPHIALHPRQISFISDRQKGLIEVLSDLFKDNPHRFCFRHYYQNFKQKFRGEDLMHLTWGAAKAYQKSDFQSWVDQLKKANEDAYNWLLKKAKVEQWARSHFDLDAKCEHITNNFSESFNKWILELREWPLVNMVEKFHLMMMSLMYERRKKARTWNINGLVPRASRIIEGLIDRINKFRVFGASDHLYSVNEYNTANRWTVDIQKHTCTCCVWDITGIPCVHGVAILLQFRPNWADYCSDYHRTSTYMRAYAGYIRPMALRKEWGEPQYKVEHPLIERPAGRPRKQRRRGEDEGPAGPKLKRKCKTCGALGHNSRTCKGAPAQGKRVHTRLKKRSQVRATTKQPSGSGTPSAPASIPTTGASTSGARSRAPVGHVPVRALPTQGASTSVPMERSQATAVAETTANFVRMYGHMPDHIRGPTIPPEQVFRPKMVPRRAFCKPPTRGV